jgi:selenide, water dikinase
VLVQLDCKFPSQRDSYQHPHPGLLGEEGAHRTQALVLVGRGGGLEHRALVRLPEPAALLERLGEDPLELWSDRGHARLGLAETVRIAQRLDRRLQLGVARWALWHGLDNKTVEPTAGAPRLTSLSHGAGCACKLPPGLVHELVGDLPRPAWPDLLVSHETADDAAVYRVAPDLALVTTVDFFTPIVDDPYDFGRVAATNALSDVYAMGGRPVTALNLVAYPIEALGREPLREILRGGADVAADAGVAIVGGHSIDDAEPKYGLAVTGVVHPDRVVRNSTARAGDALWLTKPVGGGVVSTAVKRGLAPAATAAAALDVMTRLNRGAAEAAIAAGASAMTDVTGFGLLGHLRELCEASGVSAVVSAGAVPAIDGVVELLRAAEPPVAGGTRRNRDWISESVDWADGVPEERRWLLCDAMTSGGLLVAAPAVGEAPGVRIGELVEGPGARIAVEA